MLIVLALSYLLALGRVAEHGLSWWLLCSGLTVYAVLAFLVALFPQALRVDQGRWLLAFDLAALGATTLHDPLPGMPSMWLLAAAAVLQALHAQDHPRTLGVLGTALTLFAVLLLRANFASEHFDAQAAASLLFSFPVWGYAIYRLLETTGEQDAYFAQGKTLNALGAVQYVAHPVSGIRFYNSQHWWPAGQADAPRTLEEGIDLIHQDDQQRFRDAFFRTFNEGAPLDVSYRLHLKANATSWVKNRGEALRDSKGHIVGVQGLMLEDFSTGAARKELQLFADRHRLILDATQTVGFIAWPDEDRIEYEGNMPNMIGVSDNQAMGGLQDGLNYVHPDDREDVSDAILRADERDGRVDITYRVSHLVTGAVRWHHMRAREFVDAEGKRGLAGVVIDDSEAVELRKKHDDLRDRYDTVTQAAGMAVWTWQLDGPPPDINRRLEELFDVPAGSYDGQMSSFLKLVDPRDRDRVDQQISEGVNSGEGFETRFRIRDRNGRLRWLVSRGFPEATDDSGRVTRMLGLVQDVSTETEAKLALEASLRKFDTATRASQIGFWSIEPESESVTLDHAARSVLGLPVEQTTQRLEDGLEQVLAEDRTQLGEKLRDATRHGLALRHDYRIKRADNSEIRYITLRGGPQSDPDGTATSLGGIIMDVTQTAELVATAASLNESLLDTLRAVRGLAFRLYPNTNQSEVYGDVSEFLGMADPEQSRDLNSLLSFIHPEDYESTTTALMGVAETGQSINLTHRGLNPNTGQVAWWHVIGKPILDGNGQPVGVAGVTLDETEVIERQEAFEALRERFDAAMRAASVGSWVIDMKERTANLDPAMLSLAELDPQQFDGSFDAFFNVTLPEDRPKVMDALLRTIENQLPVDTRFRFRSGNGEIRWWMARGTALEVEDEEVTRVSGATWDITDLMALTEALERSNRELDDFAHIASHDLREPLRGINNYARFLREDYADLLEGEGLEMLLTLEKLSARLDQLLRDLLEYSRVGRSDLAVEPTDLDALLKSVLQTLDFSLREHGVELRIPEPLPTVKCDRVRVGQLFHNLIVNAAKYNDKSHRWIEIGHDAGRFHVRDNGIGIAEADRESIFTLFKRLHGRDEFGDGTGAGLTISRQIVERHGGELWMESTPGVGTTFYFTLAPESE